MAKKNVEELDVPEMGGDDAPVISRKTLEPVVIPEDPGVKRYRFRVRQKGGAGPWKTVEAIDESEASSMWFSAHNVMDTVRMTLEVVWDETQGADPRRKPKGLM